MIKVAKTEAELKRIASLHFSVLEPTLREHIAHQRRYSRTPEKNHFLDYVGDHLREIIAGDPQCLQILSSRIGRRYALWKNSCRNPGTATTIVKSIFNYEDFRDKERWGAYALVKALTVPVCPYCNRQYISIVDTDSGRTRPQLDHFFSKEKHPYFALSFYNLIPSCSVCNASLKLRKSFRFDRNIHPFVDDGDELFHFRFHQLNATKLALHEDDIEIAVVSQARLPNDNFERMRRNLSVFKIVEIYATHRDLVLELIEKRRRYSDSQIREFMRKRPDGPSLFNSRQDILRLILGNYVNVDDLGRRPLAKLTRDVARQLEFL